jgi:mannose-6-phosphate isomerase
MPVPDLAPLCLGPNFVYHVPEYRGGGEIARFRGIEPVEHNSPEDWVGSATTRYQNGTEGLTTLPDGRYLRDAIEKDPEGYLGPEHVARFGANPGVLIKLIDSARRLMVHLHPDDDFARRHLGCDYGKTEAWVVLATVGDGVVWLGFTREVGAEELAEWRAQQAVEEMLATMHRVPVQAGAAILVPAGVPHAIGAGVLVLELQQPTDFGIALERRSQIVGDLGLSPDVALTAVDRSAWSPERLQGLMGRGATSPGPVLPAPADPFFRTELVSAKAEAALEPGFAVVVGIKGTGELRGNFAGDTLPLRRGSTVLLPFGAGATTVVGDVDVIECRPADPETERPPRPIV